MKIGDEVYVHGYIDEIRNDVIIIRNEGGYFGTVPSEVVDKEETLQNLTKPNKSDLISRQAAIDALYDKGLSMTAWGELLAMKWSDIQTCIELLPSAQLFTAEQIQTMQELESAQVEKAYELGKADRPTGRWHIEPGIGCFCSKCSFDIGNDLDFMEYVHYCPNCGARMESEGECQQVNALYGR